MIKTVRDSAEEIARRLSLPERDRANPNRIFGLVSRGQHLSTDPEYSELVSQRTALHHHRLEQLVSSIPEGSSAWPHWS